MNISGIYKIQSLSNPQRIYIGSAMDIYKRWEQHLFHLSKNKHHSQKLQRHFNKYGKNDLVFSIVIGCDKADLITTEQYFIDSLHPYFNGRLKAFNNGGFNQTREAKRKISESKRGKKHHYFGKHRSEETRKKISESKKGISATWNIGRVWTEEAKKKMSECKTGCKNPHIGNRPSDEGIRIIKEKLKGRIPWNKGKPYPHKGYIHSDEQKRKVSESLKKHNELKRMRFSIN